MIIKESTVTHWLTELANGNVNEQNAPKWLLPFIKSETNSDLFDIADKTVSSTRIVSRFGREGLQLNRKLDSIVGESIQLASAIEEMSATAQEIEQLGHTVLERAQDTATEADKGNESLSKLVNKLDLIEESIKKVGENAESFVEQTQSIIQLTTTVNEIADQTNLLALNAAIEAARAGEFGRGFSVVADEVRGLAHRSAEAASEIESIVSGVVSGANNVEKLVKNTITTLADSHADQEQLVQTITDARSAANNNVGATSQISAAATEQACVSKEMAQSVQSTSDGINESSRIFKAIFDNIEHLRDTQVQCLSHFDSSNKEMLLRLAKSDHIVWVDKVIRFSLFGQRSIKESELKDHTQCRLGKFLLSDEGQDLSAHKRFDELFSKVHPKVHKLGIEIYQQASNGDDNEKLEAAVGSLIEQSDIVLEILDELIAA